MKRIYLDYASLTPIDKRVAKEMKKYLGMDYMNPSSIYASGVKSKKAILEAKKRIAAVLNCHADEIIFTSGGTESNQLVLSAFKNIVTSSIEHSSIKKGNKMVEIGVDSNGIINLEELRGKITKETELVSVMMVNNETGAIQPISEIAKIVRAKNKEFGTHILFHTDASQAAYLSLHNLGVDLITLDGHKIYGPRGMGILYVRRGTVKIERPGTENVPGIMGFALALEITEKTREKEFAQLSELKKFFMKELQKEIPGVKMNGTLEKTSPHILNISIPGIDNEFFVLKLDAQGIECSTKSACLHDEDESYVLKAMNADSKTSARFSFGRFTSKSDLKKALKTAILTAWSISQNNK